MIRFQVGKTYVTGLMADHAIRLPFTVMERTTKTVFVLDKHKVATRFHVGEIDGEECIRPLGRSSTAPLLRAGRDLVKS